MATQWIVGSEVKQYGNSFSTITPINDNFVTAQPKTGECAISFSLPDYTQSSLVGLSKLVAGFGSIDFAFYSGWTIDVKQLDTYVPTGIAQKNQIICTIEYVGTSVNYYINGALIFSSPVAAGLTLMPIAWFGWNSVFTVENLVFGDYLSADKKMALSAPIAPKIIPAYLYEQYKDDADLMAFVREYNAMAQEYLDYANALNLPIYSGLSGGLLDWVGEGLYGLSRPSLQGSLVSDATYKRLLTWRMYKGDGKRFSVAWLKKRVQRWMDGDLLANPDTRNVSVTFQPATNIIGEFNSSAWNAIGLNTLEISPPIVAGSDCLIRYATNDQLFNLLQEANAAGLLDLPFQYKFIFSNAVVVAPAKRNLLGSFGTTVWNSQGLNSLP